MDKPAKKTFRLYDAGGDLTKNWFVTWYEDGKRIRKYGLINQETTEEGRRRVAAEMLRAAELYNVPPSVLVAQREKMYEALETYKKNIRKSTYEAYRWKLNHLFDFLGDRELTAETLRAYFEQAGKEHAPTTVHNTRLMMNKLLDLVGLRSLLDGITVRRGNKTPLRYFQPHQVRQLTAYLLKHDPQLLLWCKFVYYCFLRPRSELRFLRVGDIFFEEKKILVRAEFFDRKPGQFLPAGAKNGKEQYVRIPDAFLPDLLPLQNMPPDAFVFPGQHGKPMGKNTLGRKFRDVLDELGYGRQYAVYSWKHTGAVACVRAGIGMKALQMQLRHHSLDQVNQYLRGLGVMDFDDLGGSFPEI